MENYTSECTDAAVACGFIPTPRPLPALLHLQKQFWSIRSDPAPATVPLAPPATKIPQTFL